jgi:hypothetical protein
MRLILLHLPLFGRLEGLFIGFGTNLYVNVQPINSQIEFELDLEFETVSKCILGCPTRDCTRLQEVAIDPLCWALERMATLPPSCMSNRVPMHLILANLRSSLLLPATDPSLKLFLKMSFKCGTCRKCLLFFKTLKTTRKHKNKAKHQTITKLRA